MFKQFDIDHDKVTINGLEIPKPSGASSTHWLSAWENAQLHLEDPNYVEDDLELELAKEREDYEETIYELEKERDDLLDQVKLLENELQHAERELEALMRETE